MFTMNFSPKELKRTLEYANVTTKLQMIRMIIHPQRIYKFVISFTKKFSQLIT